jgi:hypothetical protein
MILNVSLYPLNEIFLSKSNESRNSYQHHFVFLIGCANFPIANSCPASSYKPIVVIYGAKVTTTYKWKIC